MVVLSFWCQCREQPNDVAAGGASEPLSPSEAKVLARHCRAAAAEDMLLWLSGYEVQGVCQPDSASLACVPLAAYNRQQHKQSDGLRPST